MGNYVTHDEVLAFKVAGSVVDLSAYTHGELDTEIALFESLVEAICNDIFYSKTEAVQINGSGTAKIFFYPVVPYRLMSITSVKEYDTDLTTLLETYVEGEDFVKFDYYLETVQWYPGDSPRRRFTAGGTWPKGQKNIAVAGAWGRSSVPAEIKRAVILLVLERLIPGSTGIVGTSIKQASWPDFSITFGGESVGMSTGFVEVDRLLELHVNRIGMFQVVPESKQLHDDIYVV